MRPLLAVFVLLTALRFTTPTANEDSTACTDLATVRLYANGTLVQEHAASPGAADSFLVDSPAEYHVTSTDSTGNESLPSNVVLLAPPVSVEETVPVPVPVRQRCGGSP